MKKMVHHSNFYTQLLQSTSSNQPLPSLKVSLCVDSVSPLQPPSRLPSRFILFFVFHQHYQPMASYDIPMSINKLMFKFCITKERLVFLSSDNACNHIVEGNLLNSNPVTCLMPSRGCFIFYPFSTYSLPAKNLENHLKSAAHQKARLYFI
jgi:hypothetical protein